MLTATVNAPTPTRIIRADEIGIGDTVWFVDFDGDTAGGPVQVLSRDGENVSVTVRADFGLGGRIRTFSTNSSNAVTVSDRGQEDPR